MGKTIHDRNQPLLPGFDGSKKKAVTQALEGYKEMDRTLRNIIETSPVRPDTEDEFELCQEMAIVLKQEIRESGLSRPEFADQVNEFLGRTEERYKLRECRKPLTKNDVDKWISEAPERPIHAYYLYAFQHVLGFGMANSIVGAKGGQVMSQEDRRLFALAKIGELKTQIQHVEKQLKQ